LGANVAIVAKAAAGIVRTGEAALDLVMGQDELLVIHVVDVRVSDGSAAAQAYACDGRCNHQFSLLCFFHLCFPFGLIASRATNWGKELFGLP
jgi:hypothetical protein